MNLKPILIQTDSDTPIILAPWALLDTPEGFVLPMGPQGLTGAAGPTGSQGRPGPTGVSFVIHQSVKRIEYVPAPKCDGHPPERVHWRFAEMRKS